MEGEEAGDSAVIYSQCVCSLVDSQKAGRARRVYSYTGERDCVCAGHQTNSFRLPIERKAATHLSYSYTDITGDTPHS